MTFQKTGQVWTKWSEIVAYAGFLGMDIDQNTRRYSELVFVQQQPAEEWSALF